MEKIIYTVIDTVLLCFFNLVNDVDQIVTILYVLLNVRWNIYIYIFLVKNKNHLDIDMYYKDRVYFSNLVNLFIIKTHAVMRTGIKKYWKHT